MFRVVIVSMFLVGYYDFQRLGVLSEKAGRGKVERKAVSVEKEKQHLQVTPIVCMEILIFHTV